MISITLQSFNDKGIMALVQQLLGNGIADREQKSSYSVPANKFYDKIVKNVNITRIGMSKMVTGKLIFYIQKNRFNSHSLPCTEINPKGSKNLSQDLYFDTTRGKDVENI